MSSWSGFPDVATEVITIDGHLVGTVGDAWPEAYAGNRGRRGGLGKVGTGYFLLERSNAPNLYVPFGAMADYTSGRVRLKYPRKQLAKLCWERPPEPPAEDSAG